MFQSKIWTGLIKLNDSKSTRTPYFIFIAKGFNNSVLIVLTLISSFNSHFIWFGTIWRVILNVIFNPNASFNVLFYTFIALFYISLDSIWVLRYIYLIAKYREFRQKSLKTLRSLNLQVSISTHSHWILSYSIILVHLLLEKL